jgi:hypothetical protein
MTAGWCSQFSARPFVEKITKYSCKLPDPPLPYPFPDSPVLTNSAWSYLRHAGFLTKFNQEDHFTFQHEVNGIPVCGMLLP